MFTRKLTGRRQIREDDAAAAMKSAAGAGAGSLAYEEKRRLFDKYQDALENGDHGSADQLHQRLKELHAETVRAASESREVRRLKVLESRMRSRDPVIKNVALQEWAYTLKGRR
jgi:hypothetical protein